MTFKDYLPNIVANKQLNILAFATTPWHIHGVVASLMCLQDLGVSINGIVFITPHSLTGYVIDESYFNTVPYLKVKKIEKEHLSAWGILNKTIISIGYILKANKQAHRVIWFIEPWTVNAYYCGIMAKHLENLEIRHVVYDEGVSTYFPIKLRSTNLLCRIQNLYTKHITFGFGYRHIQTTKQLISAKLFNVTNKGQLVTNDYIIPYYKKAIKRHPDYNFENYTIEPNTILICTTAWERKEIVNNEDVILFHTIANALLQKGYRILFKQHPRDCCFSELYEGFSVMPQSKNSLESILLSSKTLPNAVISISSTILVTCKLFLNIKAIDASRLLDKSMIGRYIDEITAFQSTFGHYVESPSTLEEMMTLLNPN